LEATLILSEIGLDMSNSGGDAAAKGKETGADA
jgi:hypothetical protein